MFQVCFRDEWIPQIQYGTGNCEKYRCASCASLDDAPIRTRNYDCNKSIEVETGKNLNDSTDDEIDEVRCSLELEIDELKLLCDEIFRSFFLRDSFSMKPLHRASNQETALLLAAASSRLDAFKVLVNETKIHSKKYLFNWKDEDGNTVLHLISASFSSDPSLKMQMLKKLLLVLCSNLKVMPVNSIWGQSNPYSKLFYLEWYKKVLGFKKKRYYDSFSNKNVGFFKNKDAFWSKECLTSCWEKLAAEAERTPWKEDTSFRTQWLYAGTNYRRMVEPIDVVEYYKHYKTNGISQHYKKLEHSLCEEGKPLSCRVSMKKQNVSASLMEDSYFWAHVEEYSKELMENYAESPETKIHNKEHLFNKKNEDSYTLVYHPRLNKSIEQLIKKKLLRLVMGVSKKVKKLTNNLQAFPVDTEHRQVKTVNSFLAETRQNSEAMANAMEACEFTAVDVPSTVLQSQSSFLANSHPKDNSPMKIKIKFGTNVCHRLLLITALVSAITYNTALKIEACKSDQGYNYNSRLISICQIVDQHPLFFRFVMVFNSIAFFLSVALLMILFNELPLRPLLLVSAFSMLGAYICAISDLTKPTGGQWFEG